MYWTFEELAKELDLDLISAHASEEQMCRLETLKPTPIIFTTTENKSRQGRRKKAPNQLVKL